MIAQHPVPIEIKAGQTVVQDFFKGLRHFENVMGGLPHGGVLVYGGDRESSRGGTRVIYLQSLSRTLDELDKA
jgi:hypothetical protein